MKRYLRLLLGIALVIAACAIANAQGGYHMLFGDLSVDESEVRGRLLPNTKRFSRSGLIIVIEESSKNILPRIASNDRRKFMNLSVGP